MRVAYIECPSGATAGMLSSAWLDTGIDQTAWRQMVEGLAPKGTTISVRTVFDSGVRSTKMDLIGMSKQATAEMGPISGRLQEMEAMLRTRKLPNPVVSQSLRAYRFLVEAEEHIFGSCDRSVSSSALGDTSTLIDIVGSVSGWYLAGMPECFAAPVEVGGGTVEGTFGRMPVPTPIVTRLLEGFTITSSGNWGDTVTPIGAAVLRALVSSHQTPEMRLETTGYGLGNQAIPGVNLLRIQLGTTRTSIQEGGALPPISYEDCATNALDNPRRDRAVILEANVDDMPAEWMAHAATVLLGMGALDTWITPVVMKKGRPGHIIHVLCKPSDRARFEIAMQNETTTIGVRGYEVERSILDREIITVETPFGSVRVKVASRNREVVNSAPEFEDCRECAIRCGVPLKKVYQEALRLAAERF